MTEYSLIRAIALEWLRYERACYITTWERGPWENLGHRPDVMGVDLQRQVTEIEIKRTLADFKHDAEKRIWQARDLWKRGWPCFFFYLVPPALVDKVLPLVRDGCGLATFDPAQPSYSGLPAVTVVRRATRQKDAKALSVRQLMEMVRHQSGTLVNAAAELARRDGHPLDATLVAI